MGGVIGMADWDGLAYRQVSDLQRWLAGEALADVVLNGDERVLDVGCGDGRITAAIARQLSSGSALGIDPSPRMLAAAATLKRDTVNLRFEPGDVLGLPFRDEFDVVVSFNALHWVDEQYAALRQIRAALHESGWALLQQVCRGDRPSLEQTAMRVCGQPRWRGYFDGFAPPFRHVDPNGYPDIADRAGFTVERQKVADLRWDFGSADAFTRWCRVGFDAWNACLPDDRAVETFVGEVVDAYAKVTGSRQQLQFLQLRARLRPA